MGSDLFGSIFRFILFSIFICSFNFMHCNGCFWGVCCDPSPPFVVLFCFNVMVMFCSGKKINKAIDVQLIIH